MSLELGVAAALVSAAMFGSQFVPLKKVKNPDMLHYSAFMYAAIFLASVAFSLLLGFPLALNYFGLAAGLVWSAGNMLQIFSISRIGLAKATAIPLGIVLVSNFAQGTLYFREPLNFIIGAAGIAVFILGIFLVSRSRGDEKADSLGLGYAFAAGILFSTPAFLFKLGALPESQFLFPMGFGILLSCISLFALKVRKMKTEEAKPALVSGIMWSIGMLTTLYAILFLGLAIGAPLTQLGLLVGVLWGLFYFREIKDVSIVKKVMLGAVLIFAAGILLTLSKVLL